MDPGDVQKPKKPQDPDAQQVRRDDIQKPEKPQDPDAQQVRRGEVQKPEKPQDPDAQQVRRGEVQKREKLQDPDAQQVRRREVQKPEKPQDPDAQQVRPGNVQKPQKPQDPDAQQVRPGNVQKPEKPQDLAQPGHAGLAKVCQSPVVTASEPQALNRDWNAIQNRPHTSLVNFFNINVAPCIFSSYQQLPRSRHISMTEMDSQKPTQTKAHDIC